MAETRTTFRVEVVTAHDVEKCEGVVMARTHKVRDADGVIVGNVVARCSACGDIELTGITVEPL